MNRSDFCATCGKKRGPLEQLRQSWGTNCTTVLIPRREDVAGKPWQQTNDLIVNAAVWRNGGTDETCHLCDDCLRVGLRHIKQVVDAALGVVEADTDKDAELARLTQQLASIQHKVAEVNQLREAGIPWMAWNHTDFLRAVAMLWSYYHTSEATFVAKFGFCADFWVSLRNVLDSAAEQRRANVR